MSCRVTRTGPRMAPALVTLSSPHWLVRMSSLSSRPWPSSLTRSLSAWARGREARSGHDRWPRPPGREGGSSRAGDLVTCFLNGEKEKSLNDLLYLKASLSAFLLSIISVSGSLSTGERTRGAVSECRNMVTATHRAGEGEGSSLQINWGWSSDQQWQWHADSRASLGCCMRPAPASFATRTLTFGGLRNIDSINEWICLSFERSSHRVIVKSLYWSFTLH